MEYINYLLQLFVGLFAQGVSFVPLIALVTVSGVFGVLVRLLRRLIRLGGVNEQSNA